MWKRVVGYGALLAAGTLGPQRLGSGCARSASAELRPFPRDR